LLVHNVVTGKKLDLHARLADNNLMRTRTITIADRTTLLPGIVSLAPDSLRRALDALWCQRNEPRQRRHMLAWMLLRQQGETHCPSGCGCEVTLEGHARTHTRDRMREEWRCHGCHDRYVLHDDAVC
jgi:hypothetical protein